MRRGPDGPRWIKGKNMPHISGTSVVVTIQPVIVPAAYADGDQIGTGPVKMTNVLLQPSGTVAIDSLAILDKAKQKASMEILFFNKLPVLTSVDNAPLDISDAEMAAKFIGSVFIDTTAYADTVSNSYANATGIALIAKGEGPGGVGGGAGGALDLYAVFKCRGAATYASSSDLVVKVGAFQD